MGIVEQMTLALTLTLNNACELQRTAQQFNRKEITRDQFVATVEEISMKLEEQARGVLCVAQKRTERCQVCDRTYPQSEIVQRGHEQLCVSCDLDRYPIRDEDIPF